MIGADGRLPVGTRPPAISLEGRRTNGRGSRAGSSRWPNSFAATSWIPERTTSVSLNALCFIRCKMPPAESVLKSLRTWDVSLRCDCCAKHLAWHKPVAAVQWLDGMSQATGAILQRDGLIDHAHAGLFYAFVQEMKADMQGQHVDLANLTIEDLGLFASPDRAVRVSRPSIIPKDANTVRSRSSIYARAAFRISVPRIWTQRDGSSMSR